MSHVLQGWLTRADTQVIHATRARVAAEEAFRLATEAENQARQHAKAMRRRIRLDQDRAREDILDDQHDLELEDGL